MASPDEFEPVVVVRGDSGGAASARRTGRVYGQSSAAIDHPVKFARPLQRGAVRWTSHGPQHRAASAEDLSRIAAANPSNQDAGERIVGALAARRVGGVSRADRAAVDHPPESMTGVDKGIVTSILVPALTADRTDSCPPTLRARSSMLTRPSPSAWTAACGSKPRSGIRTPTTG